jgi:hypothetical protein
LKVLTTIRYTGLFIIILCVAYLLSCKKTDENITGKATIALVNSAYGVELLHLALSGNTITSSPVNFGEPSGTLASPYIAINAGMRNFSVLGNSVIFYNANYNIRIDRSYSLFAYDTISNSGSLKTLLVQDDLSLPDSGSAAIRFFNLSRDAGVVDISFLSASDTLFKTGVDYAGNTTPDDALAVFNALDSGTYLVTATVADTTIQLATSNNVLAARKKYTFFLAGRRSDASLRLYSFPHF